MSVSGAGAAIAWAAGDPGVGYAAIGMIGLIVLFALWRMFRFADAHPEVAILEGAEFLRWRELEMAQKGKGMISVTESESPDATDLTLPESRKAAALELPDPEVSEDSKPKRRRTNG